MPVKVTGGDFERKIRADIARARVEAAKSVGPALVRALQSSLAGEFKSVSRLRKSKIRWMIRSDGALVVRDRSKTARVFEEGGTITPRDGRYLIIPFTPFAYAGRDHDRKNANGDRLGDFLIRGRSGGLVLMRNVAGVSHKRKKAWRKHAGVKWGEATPKAVPVALLVTHVQIRARTRFKAVAASFGPKYVAALRRALKRG